jgi:hypothetical protein
VRYVETDHPHLTSPYYGQEPEMLILNTVNMKNLIEMKNEDCETDERRRIITNEEVKRS